MSEFNKEDWKQQKEENKRLAYEMLEDATTSLSYPDSFMNYLYVQSKFDRYSVSNALLIAYQLPEATRLGDSKFWQNAGAYINKGEKGITILEPSEYTKANGTVATAYNPKKVFDISQTNAEPKQTRAKHFNERLLVKALCNASPVPIEISDLIPEEAGAVYQPDNKKILVRQGMTGDNIFRAVAKEIAHARLDKGNYSRDKCETIAYGVACIVCLRFGVEPSEMKKSDLFAGMEPKDIRKELSKIRSEANSLSEPIMKAIKARNRDVR